MKAKAFFEHGLSSGCSSACANAVDPSYPMTDLLRLQAGRDERRDGLGIVHGWETMLDGLSSGRAVVVTGTWPLRSEMSDCA